MALDAPARPHHPAPGRFRAGQPRKRKKKSVVPTHGRHRQSPRPRIAREWRSPSWLADGRTCSRVWAGWQGPAGDGKNRSCVPRRAPSMALDAPARPHHPAPGRFRAGQPRKRKKKSVVPTHGRHLAAPPHETVAPGTPQPGGTGRLAVHSDRVGGACADHGSELPGHGQLGNWRGRPGYFSRSRASTSSSASGALSTYGVLPASRANSSEAACRNRRLRPICSRSRLLTAGSPYLSSPATA